MTQLTFTVASQPWQHRTNVATHKKRRELIGNHFASFLDKHTGGEGPGALAHTGKLLKWEAEISSVWEGVN